MSNVTTLLDKYSAAVKNLKDYQELNKDIFAEQQKLVFAMIDAENEVKDEVALTKEVAKNKTHEIKRTPQSQTFADIEVIDYLIEVGVIPVTRRAEIVKTVERPDYVGIRELPQD